MAHTEESGRTLRKEVVRLHVMLVLLILMGAVGMYWLTELIQGITLAYLVGLMIALVGIVVVGMAVYNGKLALLASGATLQFVGAGIASIGALKIDDLVSIVVIMALGPLSLCQYPVGSCILTIRGYTEAEGVDFPPITRDFQNFIYQQVRTVFVFMGATFMISLLAIGFVAFFADAMNLNSLALMGVLIGVVVAGGALLLFLKGGKVVLTEIPDKKVVEPSHAEKPKVMAEPGV
jgi:hypothetical protein